MPLIEGSLYEILIDFHIQKKKILNSIFLQKKAFYIWPIGAYTFVLKFLWDSLMTIFD